MKTSRLAGQKILLVEDEILIALDLECNLLDAGAEVVGPAMSAEEALELLETSVVTAALIDVQLGDHDSRSVAERLAGAGIPFVLHTGNRSDKVFNGLWPDAPVVRKPAAPDKVVEALVGVAKWSGKSAG